LSGIFSVFLQRLQRGQQLSRYRLLGGKYLVAIDGSQYFSSDSISCPRCLKTESAKGDIHYHHQILQAVIVHPDLRQVLPLFPEPIQGSDCAERQDCEVNAGKRIIATIRTCPSSSPPTVSTPDSLSSMSLKATACPLS